MQPKDCLKPSIDPRRLVREKGSGALAETLVSAGYVPQPRTLSDLALALRRARPLLLGGHRGIGKTALGEALAESCNLTMFYVPGIEGLTPEDVFGGWNRAEQDRAVREALAAGVPLEAARRQKWTAGYFESGEFLEAYSFAAAAADRNEPPPVLLLDEIEKLSPKLQHTLLQPLARGWADVPKLEGVIGVRDRASAPIVILTSNDLSRLSEPLTSRCFVSWMEAPTPEDEIAILLARVPEAGPEQICAVASLVALIRRDMPEIRNKPGLRESIDLLEALAGDGTRELTEKVIGEYLACIGKGQKELQSLRQSASRLAMAARRPDPQIIESVQRLFAGRYRELVEVA